MTNPITLNLDWDDVIPVNGNLIVADSLGLSANLWKGFPLVESLIYRNLNVGFGIYPNLSCVSFEQGNNDLIGPDGLTVRKDTTDLISQLADAQGGIRITNHATDNNETYLQWGHSQFMISDALKELVFECCFRTSTITDARHGFFIGLAEGGLAVADTITDDGALPDKDFLGIWRNEADGDAVDVVYRKEGQALQTLKADWKVLAAATWYHFGMRFNPVSSVISFWWGPGARATAMIPDGDVTIGATEIAAATFPAAQGMSPFIGTKQAHATTHTLDIRLLACAQRAFAAS